MIRRAKRRECETHKVYRPMTDGEKRRKRLDKENKKKEKPNLKKEIEAYGGAPNVG